MSVEQGKDIFDRARFGAFVNELKGLLTGQPTELLSFDEIKSRLKLRHESYKGLMEVPLNRIVGSVGRYRDFTSTFLPKNSSMSERWSRIYERMHSLEGLPPVELYQVDDVFFVRDGNHRVSVARRLGHKVIEAYVTELFTPVDLEPGMTPRQMESAEAYANFLEETGLDQIRPRQVAITLSEPKRYADLLLHIEICRQMLEHKWNQNVEMREAVEYWYDHVYEPTIKLIRKYGVLSYTPKYTEADLYLWLMEYLWQLRQEYGEKGGEYKISAAIMEFLDKNGIETPASLPWEPDKPVF